MRKRTNRNKNNAQSKNKGAPHGRRSQKHTTHEARPGESGESPKGQSGQRSPGLRGPEQKAGGANRTNRRNRRAGGGDRRGSQQVEGQGQSQGGTGPKGPAKQYKGRVQKNPKGFAFILSQDPGLDDTYVDKTEARILLNDDLVAYTVRREGRRLSAEVLEILERGQKEVVGQIDRGYLVTPEGESYMLKDSHKLRSGDWAIAEIIEYPTFRAPAKVEIRHNLGPDLTPEHDIRIATAQFGIPTTFSTQALREAESALPPNFPKDFEGTGRKDLRKLPFVTIDGEDAKDFDDAILVETKGKSPYILYVAIADVSHYVREGQPLDIDARARSTSVYFPGVCIPMLPEKLSNDLCSLRPKQERLTLNAEIHFDRDGKILHSLFYEGIIQTAARLTYTQVQAYFNRDEAVRAELSFLSEPLDAMLSLFRKMLVKRKERGTLDFDLPECEIKVDKQGKPITVRKAERGDSNKVIEEFMIAANREVARALREGNELALYRVHESPDPSTSEDINQLMKRLGFANRIGEVNTHSLSKLLADTVDTKGSKTLHQAILRFQKQARYQPEPNGHFGLALRDYAHFTSPIRRYPDLVVHRALKKLTHRKKPNEAMQKSGEPPAEIEDFEVMGAETSERERRAMEAERFVVKRKQCWFMKDKVGEVYEGIIAGVTANGAFVEIPQFALEGFVPLEALQGYYQFDEGKMCLRKRPGHTTLSLGDPLTVQVEMVSIDNNRITLREPEGKDTGDTPGSTEDAPKDDAPEKDNAQWKSDRPKKKEFKK